MYCTYKPYTRKRKDPHAGHGDDSLRRVRPFTVGDYLSCCWLGVRFLETVSHLAPSNFLEISRKLISIGVTVFFRNARGRAQLTRDCGPCTQTVVRAAAAAAATMSCFGAVCVIDALCACCPDRCAVPVRCDMFSCFTRARMSCIRLSFCLSSVADE